MKKILLLINPFSGKGQSNLAADFVEKNLDKNEWEIEKVLSKKKGFFTEFLKEKDTKNYHTIVVFGGDGTMHEVVNGVAEKEDIPPIQLFPCGTGNAFNHDIGCLTFENAINRLKKREIQEIDFFEIKPKNEPKFYAFNIVGWGLVSDINKSSEKLRWMGELRYTIGSLIQIFRNPIFKGKLTIENEILETDFCFILACNTKHTGKAMKMAPLADLSDGFLDILIVKHLPFYHLLRLFPLIFSGKHIHSPLLTYKKVSSFSIDDSSQILNIDGEMKSESPFSVKVLDKKLKMIV